MEKILFSIYKLLNSTPAGRIIIGKTEFEVIRYLPFDDYGTGIKTMSVFLINVLKSLCMFLAAILIAGFDIKYFLTAVFASVALYKDSFVKWRRVHEIKILKQLSEFIGELRHEYYRNEDVEEAFSAAFSASGEELKLHLGIIEESFGTDKMPEKYRLSVPTRFLTAFISICRCTIKYGDENMTFTDNIDELQKNIDVEILKADKESFVFNMAFGIIILPVLCLPVMERWAVSQVGELSSFYNDYRGSFVRGAVIFITSLMIMFFESMQKVRHEEITPLLSYIVNFRPINKSLKIIFENRFFTDKRTIEIFKKYFPGKSYMNFLIIRAICFFLLPAVWIYMSIKWRFSLILYPICFPAAFLASYFPYAFLAADGLFYESELEEEISQIRILLSSLSRASGITAEEILLWTEDFAHYLREPVSRCLDSIGSDEEAAFAEMRENFKGSGFINIIDSLAAGDKIGLKEAFKGLHSRRDYYGAKRRQEQDITVRKKEAILNTFMYLPFMAATAVYMICPFLYTSISNLLRISENFK